MRETAGRSQLDLQHQWPCCRSSHVHSTCQPSLTPRGHFLADGCDWDANKLRTIDYRYTCMVIYRSIKSFTLWPLSSARLCKTSGFWGIHQGEVSHLQRKWWSNVRSPTKGQPRLHLGLPPIFPIRYIEQRHELMLMLRDWKLNWISDEGPKSCDLHAMHKWISDSIIHLSLLISCATWHHKQAFITMSSKVRLDNANHWVSWISSSANHPVSD